MKLTQRTNLRDVIVFQAERAITEQHKDGSMPPGHNGPYKDKDTPVRNTSHWLILMYYVHKWTGKKKFYKCARGCAEYLTSKAARPFNKTFFHRENSNVDRCNGLIGQAWSIEAMKHATDMFEDEKYTQIAEDVFFLHNFKRREGLWFRRDIRGDNLPIDSAFNHQLWFAAAASSLDGRRKKEIRNIVDRFIETIPMNMTLLQDGTIYHPIERIYEQQFKGRFITRRRVGKLARSVLSGLHNRRMPIWPQNEREERKEINEQFVYKSRGYQTFNLHGFALMKKYTKRNEFWKSRLIRRAMDCVNEEGFEEKIKDNKYGYHYNPPGFEIPFAMFGMVEEELYIEMTKKWIRRQLQSTFDEESCRFKNIHGDIYTATARLYEIAQLPEVVLEKIEI